MSKNKNHQPAAETLIPPGEKGFFAKNAFLKIFLIYAAVLLFVFAPVLTRPMEAPDSISQAYPVYSFSRSQILQHGTLPFWFPYMSGGTPYVEGMHPNHLFDLLVYLFPIPLGIGYRAMIFVLLAGLFGFLFFRSLRFSKPVAFLAGLAYMLSGDAISYSTIGHYGKVVNMAFLPLALLFINAGFDKRKLVYFLFAGLPLGFMFKGHPQVFYYNMMIITAFFAFRLVRQTVEEKKAMTPVYFSLGFLAMGAAAVLVSLDNLWGQLSFVKMTSRGAETDPVSKWQFATSWSMHPMELLGYLLPGVFGLKDSTYLGWRPFISTSDYAGLLVFAVAVFGAVRNWKDRTVKFFSVIALLAVLYGFGSFFAPYFKVFYNYFPMMKSFRVPSSVYIPVAFLIVFFFAYGLRSILETDPADKKASSGVRTFVLVLLASVLCLSLFVGSGSYLAVLKSNLGLKLNLQALYQQYQQSQVDAYVTGILSSTKAVAQSGLKMLWTVAVLFAGLLLLFSVRRIKQPLFVFLLFVLVSLDLVVLDRQFIRSIDSYDAVSTPDDTVRFLQSDPDRFRLIPFPPSIDNDANKWVFFKLESAYGYNAVGLKIFDDIQNSGLLGRPEFLDPARQDYLMGSLRFLGLFNVKYLLATRKIDHPALVPVFQGQNKIVYFNRLYLPRLQWVRNYAVVTNDKESLQALWSPGFDPRRTVLLDRDPGLPQAAAPASKATNSYTVEKWGLDEIRLKVGVANPSFLLLSDVYYPKWRCYVDGRETRVFRSDYLFRSVWLEQGDHEVVFRYHNDGIYLLTMLVGLCSSLFLIVFILARRKKYFGEQLPG